MTESIKLKRIEMIKSNECILKAFDVKLIKNNVFLKHLMLDII